MKQRLIYSTFLVLILGTGMFLSGGIKANEQLEYGEYLAGECTSCHNDNSQNQTIPSLKGITAESFIQIINDFKNGKRDNPAMVSVAKSLDDEQIKALAAYFSSLKND